MKKSLSRHLWATVEAPSCDLETLKNFELKRLDDAETIFTAAFNNCRKRKLCSPDMMLKFNKYEDLVKQDNDVDEVPENDEESINENTIISDEDRDIVQEIEGEEALAELMEADLDESFDIHPLRQYSLSYLKGDGQIEWERCDNSTPLAHEKSLIAEQLQEYRKKSLIGAKYNKNLSDSRIFHQQIGRNLCDCVDGINCAQDCCSLVIPQSDYTHKLSDVHTKPFEVDSSIPPLIQKVINNFHNHLRQWNNSNTMSENQFVDQAVFTLLLPLFEFRPEYEICKYDKFMAKSTYKPDFLVKLNIVKNVQIDFFTVEIKKPGGNLFNQLESDFVKIHRQMKFMVDSQIELGVDDPICYAMLVEGYDISLFTMKLEFDGEYRARLVSKCRTIRDRDDLQLLCRTTDLLLYLDVS
ncbi:MAG: hypothetical protein EXX96DRAFT_622664 [Benjaminiella poitrasii]|nr:MAG: hypothetical protein EXX96DRAFT_622664 [Benjaminiella poitrasii]